MRVKKPFLYYILNPIAKLYYMNTKVEYRSKLDDEPAIFICNHARIDGPNMMTMFFKRPHYNWVIHCALNENEAVNYAYHDILLGDIRKHKRFFHFLSRRISKILPRILNSCADNIEVYHDIRFIKTINKSLDALINGNDIVIFAESANDYSKYIANLQTGFVFLAEFYYRKTGKRLKIYPTYACRKRKRILIGNPIEYDNNIPLKEEMKIINDYLTKNITDLALSLKKHKPITFLPNDWYKAYGQYQNDLFGYWKMIEDGIYKKD